MTQNNVFRFFRNLSMNRAIPGNMLLVALLSGGALLSFPAGTMAQSRTETFSSVGDLAPDGNGAFSSFGNPVLNDFGQVAFHANLSGTSGGFASVGIFRGTLQGVGMITQIARGGQAAEDSNGVYSSFGNPVLNGLGQTAFQANLSGTAGGTSDNNGIFRGSGGAITQVVRKGQAAPDGNGAFSSFSEPRVNGTGDGFFEAMLDFTSGGIDNQGIFSGHGGTITQIVRMGQSAPDGNGEFSTSGLGLFRVVNDFGNAAFWSFLTDTSGGTSDDQGIFIGHGGAITQIARKGQSAPDNNGDFDMLAGPLLNNSGEAAFKASLSGTSGGGVDDNGIFLGNGGAITQIVRKGELAPDGNGTYQVLLSPSGLNNAGQIVFRDFLNGTSGGSSDNRGIFRSDGGVITQIARSGQMAPDGIGVFSNFNSDILNDSGQVAFMAVTTGPIVSNQGIFTSDGIESFQVVRKGDILGGSTVTAIETATNDWLNKHGQIAYRATLADGNQLVQLWTPELHWRTGTSGSWDTSPNWTLGLTPAIVHDVFIDPDSDVTVTGPNSGASVRTLQIGGGTGHATLVLQPGGDLFAVDGLIVESNGTLAGSGTIVGEVFSFGKISPGLSAGSITIDGDLILDETSSMLIELGGLDLDYFDRFSVLGDVELGGDLLVNLINGHTLGGNQFYLIGDISGDLFGEFDGFGEGAVVGNFNGVDLYITYAAGNGNGIALFTAVPEPSSGCLLLLLGYGILVARRRRPFISS